MDKWQIQGYLDRKWHDAKESGHNGLGPGFIYMSHIKAGHGKSTGNLDSKSFQIPDFSDILRIRMGILGELTGIDIIFGLPTGPRKNEQRWNGKVSQWHDRTSPEPLALWLPGPKAACTESLLCHLEKTSVLKLSFEFLEYLLVQIFSRPKRGRWGECERLCTFSYRVGFNTSSYLRWYVRATLGVGGEGWGTNVHVHFIYRRLSHHSDCAPAYVAPSVVFWDINSCKGYLNAKKLNTFYIHFFAICHLGKPLILQ